MANITIPNLPSATAATDLDILVIVDSGETTTSKITKADLLSGIGGSSPWIEGDGTGSASRADLPTSATTGTYNINWGGDTDYVYGNRNILLGGRSEYAQSYINAGQLNFVVGGYGNKLDGGLGQVIIGNESKIQNTQSFNVIIGSQSIIDSNSQTYNTIIGGGTNLMNGGEKSAIIAGQSNASSGDYSVINGGINNVLDGYSSGIYNSSGGFINNNVYYSSILTSDGSTINGGFYNNIIGNVNSDISGGNGNTILGGSSSDITSTSGYNTLISNNFSNIKNGSRNLIAQSQGSNIQTSTSFSTLMLGNSTNINGGQGVVVLNDRASTFDTNGNSKSIANYNDSIFAASNEDIDIRINGGVGSSGSTFAIGSVRSWIGNTSTTRGNIRGSGMINAVDSYIQNTGATYTKNNYIIGGTNVAIEENTKVMTLNVDNYTATTDNIVVVPQLVMTEYSSLNFSGDTAAAAGGVVLGGIYHDNGALRVRIS